MGLLLDMPAYLRRMGHVKPLFDAWVHDVGLAGLLVTELELLGEGPARIVCHDRDEDGKPFLREDRTIATVERVITLATPPPPESFEYFRRV